MLIRLFKRVPLSSCGGVGRVCTVIFVSNPTTADVVLRLSSEFDNKYNL